MTNWKQNPLHRETMAWCQCSNNNGQVFVQGYLIYDAPLPNHHSQLLCAKIFGRQPSANREMGRKEKLQNNFPLIFTLLSASNNHFDTIEIELVLAFEIFSAKGCCSFQNYLFLISMSDQTFLSNNFLIVSRTKYNFWPFYL